LDRLTSHLHRVGRCIDTRDPRTETSPEWVAITSILVLPELGYRVRVVMDAQESG